MKVAVTGASGFIGRHVVRELHRRGVSPHLVIRSSTGSPPSLDSLPCTRFDLHAPPAGAFEALGSPDILIHLAWGGLPNYRSLHHFERELPAQFHFLKSLVQSGLKNLLVTGTCFEYGMESGPLHETLRPDPTNAYALAKDALRRQLQYLQKFHSFQLTWTRLFYIHGEGQPPTSLRPQLEAAIDRCDESFNMSPGDQLRDYLPVEEVARTLVDLALTGRGAGIVNVCSGRPISVRRLVESWIEARESAIRLNLGHYSYPDYEPMAFWGSRTRLDRFLSRS